MGYYRAGFDVVGVDIRPQPRYPFEFVQADAMTYPLDGFDAIHASPPCQRYSVANNIHKRADHPDLLPAVRDRIRCAGVPWVMENVPGAPMRDYITLCGLTLGCNVKRHRLFEFAGFWMWGPPPCPVGHPGDWLLVFGHTVLNRGQVAGKAKGGGNVIKRQHVGTDRGREAMGIDWMTRDELSEAIPPAYTEFIGRALMAHLQEAAA